MPGFSTHARALARVATFGAALSLTLVAPAIAKPPPPARDMPVVVETRAINQFCLDGQERGALRFLGGLELTSSESSVGGLSGMVIDSDGAGFLAVSDAAVWLKGRFVSKGGRLAGLSETRVAPVIGNSGRLLGLSRGSDTESMTRRGNEILVGVEGINAVLRFDVAGDGLAARATRLPAPKGVAQLPSNSGLEGIALAPPASPIAGTLVAVAERAPRRGDVTAGFLIGGPVRGAFKIKIRDDYSITDLAFLPDGDLLLLERWYSGFVDIRFRIRRIAAADIRPDAVLDGPVLIEADRSCEIDNMEALGVSRDEEGQTILTLLSDDNFSVFQRTLVLRFALKP